MGHSTDIYGDRYQGVSVNTAYADLDDRMSRPINVELGFVANTSIATEYFAAPGDGHLVDVVVQGSVTSDATKTYTLTVENGTQTMLLGASQVYDADPILTADTAAFPALNATRANLAVSTGDIIEVSHTGGVGSGNVSVLLIFELDG
jgi:hypothetical protein